MFPKTLHSRVAEVSNLERWCIVERMDDHMVTLHVLWGFGKQLCTWDLSQTIRRGKCFVYLMARRINTYIAHQELPDKAADTPAYTCQALHEESFEIHTCLHIARAKLCPTNTHMSKAFDPLQSTASVQSKSRSETLDRENAKLSCFLDSAEMCSRRTSSTRCVE